MVTSSARYRRHFNAIGNTTALTDMSQHVVNKYAYDANGNRLSRKYKRRLLRVRL